MENEVYIIAKVPKQAMEFALCIDTLGQGRRLSEEDMETIKRFALLFRNTCERLDRAIFTAERLKRKSEVAGDAETSALSEDEIKDEKERIQANLERLQQPFTEKDVEFQYIKATVNTLREQIAEFKTYNVFKGHMEVILALLYMLDYKKNDLMGSDGNPSWKKIRTCFNDNLFNAITSYEPRDQQVRSKGQKYATVKSIQKMLKDLDAEVVHGRNKRVGTMYDYVLAAIEVKAQAKTERKEAKKLAEEEARLAAEAAALEEEEAAKAAAEALAAGEAPAE